MEGHAGHRLVSARSALALGTLVFALIIVGLVLVTSAGESEGQLIRLMTILPVVAIGTLVAGRRPRNPLGWLLLGAGLFFSVNDGAGAYAVLDYRLHHGTLPLGRVALAVQPTWAGGLVLVTGCLWLFPDGHLPSERWRRVSRTLFGAGLDAVSWARKVDRLQVDHRDGVRGTNVAGRRLTGPVQGFGKMWQKTYRMDAGPQVQPQQAIATWREHFPEFWPKGNRFAGALTGINPGDVALLDLAIGGGVKLSTGVFVLYADAESFTLMTPQGHQFAGWITFSAEREGDTTAVQAQALMRANDPLYEIAMPLGGHRMEDKFWAATLTALGQRLGIGYPQVEIRKTCVDSRRQWRHAGNIWHNSMVRSVLQTLASPVTGLGHLMRGSKSGMKSQPNG